MKSLILFWRGSILGITANNKNNHTAINGTRNSPQNFEKYPSATPSMFQWDAIWSGI